MKMAHISLILLLVIFTSAAFADRGRDGHMGMMDDNDMPMAGDHKMPMMDDENRPMASLDQMQQHMDKMRDIIARINQTQDRTERQKLRQQHLNEMRQSLSMMQSSRLGDTLEAEKQPTEEKALQKRNELMEQRIAIMQEMMQQMVDQQA